MSQPPLQLSPANRAWPSRPERRWVAEGWSAPPCLRTFHVERAASHTWPLRSADLRTGRTEQGAQAQCPLLSMPWESALAFRRCGTRDHLGAWRQKLQPCPSGAPNYRSNDPRRPLLQLLSFRKTCPDAPHPPSWAHPGSTALCSGSTQSLGPHGLTRRQRPGCEGAVA
jgi:hypothetical protein